MSLYVIFLSYVPFFFMAWMLGDPYAALQSLLRLRRWARRQQERRYGVHYANVLFKELRKVAKKDGISKDTTEKFISEVREQIIAEEGQRIVNQLFGEYERHPLEME